MSNPEHHYYVYIVASRTHILYIGITDNIERRVEQHRNAEIQGFTATYHCNRLVFWEPYQYVQKAIAREKQLKRWRRSKKIWLIELANPTWADLSDAWTKPQVPPLRFAPIGMTIPGKERRHS
jgi:putative endonuclease